MSSAGARAGLKDGTRSGLWSYMADAINTLRPSIVIIENVRGLLSARAHRHLESVDTTVGNESNGPVLRAAGAVLGDLADLGYDARWATVAAASVGAPHRRERVFIIAQDAASTSNRSEAGDQAGRAQAVRSASGTSGSGDRDAADAPRNGWDGRPGDQLPIGAGDLRRVGGQGTTAVGDGGGLDVSHAPRDGWDEGRPELARLVGGSDAAVSGDEPGRVELLPTPVVTDAMGARNSTAWRSNPDHGISIGDTLTDAMWKLAADRGEMQLPTGPARGSGDEPGVALLPTPAAGNFNDGEEAEQWLARQAAVKERLNNGNGMGMPLAIAVQLLPTPGTMDDREKRTTHAGGNLTLQGAIVGVNPVDVERHSKAGRAVSGDDVALLPTPQAFDRVDHVRSPEKIAATSGGCRNLRESVVNELLPTPNSSDWSGGGQHPDRRVSAKGIRHSRQLADYVKLADDPGRWGKYEPAIRRWEQIVGPAPAPTEPNKNGNPRLSAAFSEWLMGWPAGWVTDFNIGISRNDQLRIVGNGVCTQQAIAALRYLLSVTKELEFA